MDADYLANGDWKPSTRWPELFEKVDVPTLVVSGDRPDEVVVDASMEKGIDAIGNPRVTVVRIAGSGHCIRREQPEQYYTLVDGWLAELD